MIINMNFRHCLFLILFASMAFISIENISFIHNYTS